MKQCRYFIILYIYIYKPRNGHSMIQTTEIDFLLSSLLILCVIRNNGCNIIWPMRYILSFICSDRNVIRLIRMGKMKNINPTNRENEECRYEKDFYIKVKYYYCFLQSWSLFDIISILFYLRTYYCGLWLGIFNMCIIYRRVKFIVK